MNEIFWLIQGHTKYYKELCACFSDKENVLWVTEEDQPNIEYIINNSKIEVLKIPRVEHGFGRILIHSNSTSKGLELLKKRGIKLIIKIRSDLIFSNTFSYENLILEYSKIHPNKIFGHCYVSHGGVFIDNPILTKETSLWLNSLNVPVTECSQNYITDWLHAGDIDELILFYSKVNLEGYNRPVICEIRFLASYLMNKKLELNFEYNYLTNHIPLLLGPTYKSNIDIFSLKEQMYYSKMHILGEKGALPDNFLA